MKQGPVREILNHELPYVETPQRAVYDPTLQNYFGKANVATPITSFDAISNLCNCYPPDPNSAAGLSHVFHTVNTHFAIYDKSGVQMQAPAQLSVLFAGVPGGSNNDGDPVVLYDRYAGRWVVMQFSIANPYYVLFAVSTSSDPLGTYNRYSYQFTAFPDYPKISVWRDAYYLTVASFSGGVTYIGDMAAAVERDSMLAGRPARIVTFQRNGSDPRLLPSDVDGPMPPLGAPNYFMGVDLTAQQLAVYQFSVNWSNPNSSTFSGPLSLQTSPFVAPVCASRNCLPQPGTSVGLDALSNLLLFRVQYRNFGTYETMVANHTVKVGSRTQAGIRWYELRRSGGNWSIYQQGTYAPDADSRWMASIAMDKYGNIGLGYSVTGTSTMPSIRFTGRRLGDPLGVMTILEDTIVVGTGVQTGTQYRWGDYTSMHLDPTDDQTFWYTNEYVPTTSAAGWRTRIGSFKLPPGTNSFVRGVITSTTGGTPVTGVNVDFVENVVQVSGISAVNGSYLSSARIDSPATSLNLTLRATKFGFIDTTFGVTLTLGDTLTRNFQVRPAPGGTLSVHSHTPTANLRSYVEVKFGSQTVVSDSTDGTTGLLTSPLPVGTYSVRVDAQSPYATLNFDTVAVNGGQTTNVDALTRAVFEFNPTSMLDTLPVGGSHVKTLAIANTTTDTVTFRISDDNKLVRIRTVAAHQPVHQYIEQKKGEPDPEDIDRSTIPSGSGGPDGFGYQWIDSDEPGGPVFSWVDISATGTALDSSSAWISTGTNRRGDEGYYPVALPFPFSFYGTIKETIYIGTNGNVMFQRPTGDVYTNSQFPTLGGPIDNHIGVFWDDLEVRAGAKVYYGTNSGNFVIQYQGMPRWAGTVPNYTFQIILSPNGQWTTQYQSMAISGGTLTSSTIGMENGGGTVGLTVVHNAAYMHNNLAIRFFAPDAPWISESPVTGSIPPNSNQDISVTFDATGLTPGTQYNANIFVETTHPDVAAPFTVPATLTVEQADSAVMALSKSSISFPATQINTTRYDTLVARNVGGQTLSISSITSSSTLFSVSPSSGTVIPGDSLKIAVSYTPTAVGTDTGRIIILSNSQGVLQREVPLTGTGTEAPSTGKWVEQTSGVTQDLRSVKTVSDSVAWAAGYAGTVVRTTNAGTTWQSVGGGGLIGIQDLNNISASSTTTAYVTTSSTAATFIYRTTDGGSNWTQVFTLSGGHLNAIHMYDATNGIACGDPVGGKWTVLRTSDGGASWSRIAIEPTPVGTERGYFNSMNTSGPSHIWFGTNNQKIYRSTDGGSSWSSATTTMGADLDVYAIQFNSLTNGLAAGQEGAINRSTNEGASWATVGSSIPATIFGMSGNPGSNEFWVTQYTSTSAGAVHYSSNSGTSWTTASPEGYVATTGMNHINMISQNPNVYGWAVGAAGKMLRYRRTPPTSVDNNIATPIVYALDQNFPNPFNPSTTIRFSLPEQATVSLKIYNLLGQEVATLTEGKMSASFHTVVWNGRNEAGTLVASGMYFYRLEAAGTSGEKFNSLKKLIFLK